MGQELMQIIYQNYVFPPRFWESKGGADDAQMWILHGCLGYIYFKAPLNMLNDLIIFIFFFYSGSLKNMQIGTK